MDTQNSATVEIPNFKLAKVGKGRDRKRGAGGWLSGGRGAGSAFSGAVGGSGAAGGGGVLGLTSAMKTALLLLMAAGASVGAWQYGKMRAAQYDALQKGNGPKVFSAKGGAEKYDDLSGVVKADNSIPNSLGYVSGSTDGLTPEERAKKAAEAEAARKAEEEAKKKADAEANKQPETPAGKDVDPNAVAESAVPKKGLTPGKFGQLGSSFGGNGGGLSGGAGLSGGINRNFAGATSLAKGQNGAVASFRNPSKPSSASAPHAAMGNSRSKGFAKRQLDNAFTQSRQATSAGKGETAASSAAAPFDNNPGVGNVIAGPGVGNGAKPGAGDGSPNTLNPGNSGGPLDGGNGAACSSADYAPDQNGVCQKITTNGPKNAAPYQWMIDMAKMLMTLTSILAALALIYALTPWTWGIAEALKKIILVIGIIEVGLGAAILAMSGDKTMGGIVMAVGALTIASAEIPSDVTDATGLAEMAAGTLISNAVGALVASSNSKSQLQ